MIERGLIERLRLCGLGLGEMKNEDGDLGIFDEAATTIARLSEALAEARRQGASAEAIIGKLQSLVTNVEYWVAHGYSETATTAMAESRKDGWAQMGWKQYLDAQRAALSREEGR